MWNRSDERASAGIRLGDSLYPWKQVIYDNGKNAREVYR